MMSQGVNSYIPNLEILLNLHENVLNCQTCKMSSLKNGISMKINPSQIYDFGFPEN